MRHRRRPYKLLDVLMSGTATHTLLTGVCCAIPLFVIPALLDKLSGNPFLPALLPAAKIALVFFGISSLLLLIVASYRYWHEWRNGQMS